MGIESKVILILMFRTNDKKQVRSLKIGHDRDPERGVIETTWIFFQSGKASTLKGLGEPSLWLAHLMWGRVLSLDISLGGYRNPTSVWLILMVIRGRADWGLLLQ
jgi:hypothetical protein